MREIKIKDEYIKLEQLLKLSGEVLSGGMAKEDILEGLVKVNGEIELRRGRKIREGDIVSYKDNDYKVSET